MKNYLLQKPSIPESRPLFQFESGAPLARATLTSHLRSLHQQQGLDETLYASHSFRIGAATAAGTFSRTSYLANKDSWTLVLRLL
jgi:hypothetical protein